MASVHFWTEAPESFIASTYCGVEAIKLSGHVIEIPGTSKFLGGLSFTVNSYILALIKFCSFSCFSPR